MAEFVEWRKERALPQYELLRSLNLCQEEEIEYVIKSYYLYLHTSELIKLIFNLFFYQKIEKIS